MTTPPTADVRAWARDNGFQVAERGRLPAEVHQAYVKATGGRAATQTAKARPVEPEPPRQAAPAAPVPDPRIAPLEARVTELTSRLEQLEQRLDDKPPSRFRRKR